MQDACCQYTNSVHVLATLYVYLRILYYMFICEFLSADVEQTVQELEPEHEMYAI